MCADSGLFLNVVMESVHVFRPAFIRGKLSSVILSPCTCRYKLLNQPHQLALAVCGGFTHTHTHTLAPLLGSLIDRIECKNFLIKVFSQLETSSGKTDLDLSSSWTESNVMT